mmetsp:Transcript_30566/g.46904  ORF Transcript_30566/g.46904 Transcript_30566/m.46904 type:complete len:240 (-) Transcript_30566:145-864(-)
MAASKRSVSSFSSLTAPAAVFPRVSSLLGAEAFELPPCCEAFLRGPDTNPTTSNNRPRHMARTYNFFLLRVSAKLFTRRSGKTLASDRISSTCGRDTPPPLGIDRRAWALSLMSNSSLYTSLSSSFQTFSSFKNANAFFLLASVHIRLVVEAVYMPFVALGGCAVRGLPVLLLLLLLLVRLLAGELKEEDRDRSKRSDTSNNRSAFSRTSAADRGAFGTTSPSSGTLRPFKVLGSRALN